MAVSDVNVTPMVAPLRGSLAGVRRFMLGDSCIGRGAKQRDYAKNLCCNDYKVPEFGRDATHSTNKCEDPRAKKNNNTLPKLANKEDVGRC